MKQDQLIHISDEEKKIKGIEKLTALIEASNEIKRKAEAIKITDDTTLKIADQIARSSKKLKKQLDDKKKEITQEWRDMTAMTNEVAKKILEPIEAAANVSSSKVVAYKEELERKKEAELKLLREKQVKIDQLSTMIETSLDSFEIDVNGANTIEDIKSLADQYINSQNEKSVFSQMMVLAEEVSPDKIESIKELKVQMLTIGKARKQEIEFADDKDKVEKIKEQREKLTSFAKEQTLNNVLTDDNDSAVEVNSKIMQLDNQKQSGIRKIKRYRIIDETKVPRELLCVDDAKVKQHMKNSDEEIAGIEFYYESTHVSR